LKTSTYLGYLDELCDNLPCPDSSCEPTSGTGVSVAAGSTTSGIDFALSPGGTITGFVTDASGLAAFGGLVWAYGSSGASVGGTRILANGLYRIWGLPADNYYVVAQGDGGLIPEVYDNTPCVGCNPVTAGTAVGPTTGTPITVSGSGTQAQTQGHVRLHPGRSRIPPSSTQNYVAGVTRANNAVIPLSAVGELAIYCAQASGTAHAIVDVNGYFK
jgi:hypothetical protein